MILQIQKIGKQLAALVRKWKTEDFAYSYGETHERSRERCDLPALLHVVDEFSRQKGVVSFV